MMGKLRQTAAATLLVVLPIGMAHAVVMDFEALEHVDASTTTTSSPYQEDGFQIAGSALSTFGTLASRFTGSMALFTNVVNGPTTFTKIGGGAFDLVSINLAELNGDQNPGALVTFESNSGNIQVFQLDGNAFEPQTFLFNSNFLGVTSVVWHQVSLFHQFDNIVIDERSVPEPTTLLLLLLGLGLAGLGFAKRRLH